MKSLVIVCVLTAAAVPATAQTYIAGHIVTNTTWTLAGSPYIIQGNAFVDASSTLTIEPGVVVQLQQFTRLEALDGSSIVAVGTSEDPILFTSDQGTPAPGDWDYVGVKHSSGSEFAHCVFEYGTDGLYLNHSDSPVSFCTVRHVLTTGISCDESSPTITSCTIADNGRGMKIFGPDTSPVINYCNLENNLSENILVVGYEELPIVTINAENNWWGTDIEEEIGWTINIHSNSEGFVEVDFVPWLHDTPVEATTWGRVKVLFQ
jgi:hypothetical protein